MCLDGIGLGHVRRRKNPCIVDRSIHRAETHVGRRIKEVVESHLQGRERLTQSALVLGYYFEGILIGN